MLPLYTVEEKLEFIKGFVLSGQTKKAFSQAHGFTAPALNKWIKLYGLPNLSSIKIEDPLLNMTTDLDKLREELAALRKEKKRLERELEKEKIRSLAYNTLIDLAESTYHIKVRKNSDAK